MTKPPRSITAATIVLATAGVLGVGLWAAGHWTGETDISWYGITASTLVVLAYFVRRGYRPARLLTWLFAPPLVIFVALHLGLELVERTNGYLLRHVTIPYDGPLAAFGTEFLSVVRYVGQPLTALGIVLAALLVSTDSAREFFGVRYQTTKDDPRLWTIKPPS